MAESPRAHATDAGSRTAAPSSDSHCGSAKEGARRRSVDWLLWGSLLLVVVGYGGHLADAHPATSPMGEFSASVTELVNRMWWGLVLAVIFIGLLGKVPREFVIAVLGPGGAFRGLLRATLSGLLLDLCNHGVLMLGARLYERGASGGQVVAFLVASPWNSLSLTLILVALIGLPLTLIFILGSLVIALITGACFEAAISRGILPANPHRLDMPADFRFWQAARAGWAGVRLDRAFFTSSLMDGIRQSRVVMRWLLFGIVLASVLRLLMDADAFAAWFGPTLAGLGLTLAAATVIEVCSEGSAPIAADLVTRAQAPGNGFTFLMAGAATDYTEIMVLREVMASWKFALFLPLISVPQILLLGWLINQV